MRQGSILTVSLQSPCLCDIVSNSYIFYCTLSKYGTNITSQRQREIRRSRGNGDLPSPKIVGRRFEKPRTALLCFLASLVSSPISLNGKVGGGTVKSERAFGYTKYSGLDAI